MEKEEKKTSRGMNFLEGLTLLFIALKLCNVIDWSWLLVLLPEIVWIGLVVSGAILKGLNKILDGKIY